MIRLVQPIKDAKPSLGIPWHAPDNDATCSFGFDRNVIADAQTSLLQRLDGQRDLMLAGNPRHAFT